MDYTLSEIVNHKNTIMNLSNQLINVYDINQEISINEELIKEAQFLLSLLNIKKNLIFNQNFQNIFQQMMPIKLINNNNNNNNFINNVQEPKKEIYSLIFKDSSGKSIVMQCLPDDKLSSVFNKFEAKIGFSDGENYFKYVCNDCVLNPFESVKEANLRNCSKIVVVDLHNDIIWRMILFIYFTNLNIFL